MDNKDFEKYKKLLNDFKVQDKIGDLFVNVAKCLEYEMYDDQNNLCAIAESKFCLIDLIKSKIARLPENLGTIYRNL